MKNVYEDVSPSDLWNTLRKYLRNGLRFGILNGRIKEWL